MARGSRCQASPQESAASLSLASEHHHEELLSHSAVETMFQDTRELRSLSPISAGGMPFIPRRSFSPQPESLLEIGSIPKSDRGFNKADGELAVENTILAKMESSSPFSSLPSSTPASEGSTHGMRPFVDPITPSVKSIPITPFVDPITPSVNPVTPFVDPFQDGGKEERQQENIMRFSDDAGHLLTYGERCQLSEIVLSRQNPVLEEAGKNMVSKSTTTTTGTKEPPKLVDPSEDISAGIDPRDIQFSTNVPITKRKPACLPCRRVRTKCDRDDPCCRCQRLKIDCNREGLYLLESVRRRPAPDPETEWQSKPDIRTTPTIDNSGISESRDSGYASMQHSESEKEPKLQPNLPQSLSPSKLSPVVEESGLENEDNQTIYSYASSLSDPIKENYISELSDALFQSICLSQLDRPALQRIPRVLPELLKAFALKIGYNAPSQTHRDVMFFIHKHRNSITGCFRERCIHEKAEEVTDYEGSGNRCNTVPLNEKIAHWQNNHEHPMLAPEHDESPDNPGYRENEPESEPEHSSFCDDKDTNHSHVYRDFIFGASAYEWLLESLRREATLVCVGTNVMDAIKKKIMGSLPLSRRISKKQGSEAFSMLFIVEWEPLRFVFEQEFEDIDNPGEGIEKAITLTGSLQDSQALTCIQYLNQTWPTTASSIMRMIRTILSEGGYTCILPDRTQLTGHFQNSRELQVHACGTADSLAEIGQQLAWLSAALRSSPYEIGIAECTPSAICTKVPIERVSDGQAASCMTSSLCRISVQVHQKDESAHFSNGRCWHHLFKTHLVVKGYPIIRRKDFGNGLEIPLNIMAGLIQTRRIQRFDEKFFIKGFSSLLQPTRKSEGIIFWHLLYNEDGSRIAYSSSKMSWKADISISDIQSARHIVGWCSEADYYAGSAKANYDVKASRLPKPHGGCQLNGVRISRGQMVNGGPPFVLGNKDKPFHIMQKTFIRKLQWIHGMFVVLWDEQDKRGWLVNGTSALLHLLQKSLEDNRTDDFSFKFCFQKKKMRQAKKSRTSSALNVLLNEKNMQQVIYRENPEDYTLRDRLDELYEVLEKAIDYQMNFSTNEGNQKPRTRKFLEGWDFNDLATNLNTIDPCVATIQKAGKGWVDLARAINSVFLFGRGFGELIRPAGERSCTYWALLPKDNYYLAAAVADLQKVMNKIGGQEENPMKVTHDIIWYSPKRKFTKCRCEKSKRASPLVTGLEDQTKPQGHTDLIQVLQPESLRNTLPKKGRVEISDTGAVIFGQNKKFNWFWRNTGDPKEEDYESSSEELPDELVDSGIGSSILSTPTPNTVPTYTCRDYKVAVLCALSKELFAVRTLFDSTHERLIYSAKDNNYYSLGSIYGHNIVAAALPFGEYGTCAAASAVEQMRISFPNLLICFLVGIGGGVPSKKSNIRLGDVVVSQPGNGYPGVIQYDLGKSLESGEFIRTGFLHPPPRQIMATLSHLSSDPNMGSQPLRLYLDTISARDKRYGYPGREKDPLLDTDSIEQEVQQGLEPHPKIHYGLIASGNKVMKNAQERDQLAAQYNVLCFEMEAAGIMNILPSLVIRGISDYSDSRKDDSWQDYASATAAAYLKLLLKYLRSTSDAESSPSILERIRMNSMPTNFAKRSLSSQGTELEPPKKLCKYT